MIAASIDREELGRLALVAARMEANRLRLGRRLRLFGRHGLVAEPEDIVQAAMLRVVREWDGRSDVRTWAAYCVRACYCDFARRLIPRGRRGGRRPASLLPLQDWPTVELSRGRTTYDPPEPTEPEDYRWELVERAIGGLTATERAALVECRLHGLPQIEHARKHGLAECRVSQIVKSALNRLREVLVPDQGGATQQPISPEAA